MVYDQAARQLLLFGGYRYSCGGAPAGSVSSTWAWNGVAWRQLHPATSPPARTGGCGAYDPVRRQVVTYGGVVSEAPNTSGDTRTWTWDGVTWTPHSTTSSPPTPDADCGMAFDADTNTIVLVVHEGADGKFGTWTWDGAAWTSQPATGPDSIAGDAVTMSADPTAGELVLYVGLEGGCPNGGLGDCLNPVSETWGWQNGAWSLLPVNTAPSSRVNAAFSYDAGTGQLVLSGGVSGGSSADWLAETWVSGTPGGSRAAVRRLAGNDRDATAIAVSQASFPAPASATSVVIARDDEFADALVGGPLAAAKGGPLLLSSSSELSPVTQAELSRVLLPHGTVYLLGGVNALSSDVATRVGTLGYSVVRLAGADRYATAISVANALGNPGTVLEADGQAFPDALSAAPAAATQNGVVLLTAGRTQAAVTASYLAAHAVVRFAVGGSAAAADPDATALVGADRYSTSAAVARAFFPDATSFAVATGANFPDGLAGGAYSATRAQPLLLVPPTGDVPEPVAAFASTHAHAVTAADVLGGSAAVDDSVVQALARALSGS